LPTEQRGLRAVLSTASSCAVS